MSDQEKILEVQQALAGFISDSYKTASLKISVKRDKLGALTFRAGSMAWKPTLEEALNEFTMKATWVKR